MSNPTHATLAEHAASIREICEARPPQGAPILDLACWYAERLGELKWHAQALADAVPALEERLEDWERAYAIIGQARSGGAPGAPLRAV